MAKESALNRVMEKFFKKKVKIRLRVKEGQVIVETKRRGLELLSELLIAHAKCADCGFSLSPRGAGKGIFTKETEMGLYIHTIPCRHSKTRGMNER